MTTELWMLAWSAALCAIMWLPYILARIQTRGLVATVGYPENPPPGPAWARRLKKAHANMVENLAPFAAVVLIADAAQVHTDMTVLGAMLFFWGRVAHVVVYTLGIPWLRTLAFFFAWIGIVMVFVELYGAP